MRTLLLLVALGCRPDPVPNQPNTVSGDDTALTVDTNDSSLPDTDNGGDTGHSTTRTLPPVAGYAFQQVLGGLEFPVDIIDVGDGTLLVAGKLGQLARIDIATHTIMGTFRVDEIMTVPTNVEQGFLSIALHPDFGNGGDPHLYSWQTTIDKTKNSLMRWDLTLEPLQLSNPIEVLGIEKYDTGMAVHNGGKLVWWDGESEEPVLYVSVGNGGGPRNVAAGQDPDHPSAGILALSIDDDGLPSPAFETPFGHPFLVAKGLRNPWRTIDCGDVLCVGDVGESVAEELNLYAGIGANFGHGEFEGPSEGVYDDPFIWYAHDDDVFTREDPDHSETRGESIMVGVHVSGTGYNGLLEDFVLYSDLYQGWIRGAYIGDDPELQGADLHLAHQAVLGAMVEVEDGTVYAVEMMGSLRRLVTHDQIPTIGEEGEVLSESTFVDGGLEYDVRYPLWSNGTTKERFIQLPTGTEIDTSDPENWIYPLGTRAYKTFFWNGQPVETRLLEKTETGWAAGVYQWSTDGSEAFLTDGSDVEPLIEMDISYTIPSTSVCQTCHGNAQDMLLGLEPFQLGSAGIAVFDPHLSDAVDIPQIEGSETEIAARGYLHGNCSTCHTGDSVTAVQLDLRYSSDPDDITGEGMYEFPGVPFLDPGNPNNSAIFRAVIEQVMPPVTLSEKDDDALGVLGDWILEMADEE